MQRKNRRNRFEIKTKNLLILCTLLCTFSIGLSIFTKYDSSSLSSTANIVLSPMKNGISFIGNGLIDLGKHFKSTSDIINENSELKKRYDLVMKENTELKKDSDELFRLKKELNMVNREKYDFEVASVIGNDANNWFNMLTINKGSSDGIEVNMNVISNGALVGIITNTSPHSSIVRTIIDDLSAVSCIVEGNNNLLVLEGNLVNIKNGFLLAKDINYSATLNKGDKILTSNISKKFLPDIPIGYISETTKDEDNLVQTAKIVPTVDFNALREVVVIKKQKEIADNNENKEN